MHPSPGRRQAELDEAARYAEQSRALRKSFANGEFVKEIGADIASGKLTF